jgi:uncharacterized protein (DUF1800 family)
MPANFDARTAWEPYRPSGQSPWDLKKVGHLYRRAGFGGSWLEMQTALKAGPEQAINRLLEGGPDLAKFDAESEAWGKGVIKANQGLQLRAWWLYRMLYTPHPLREKLTLFWHNHFATSNAKVNNAAYMHGQYELMRQHALGSFRTLLQEMSKDPAMLVWLDTNQSVKGKPNENYARELMELFSLGVGTPDKPNYAEKDIREAARAFTGWEIKDGKGSFTESRHDATEKTVLGKKGNFKGTDVVEICLEQKICADFIVEKLYRFLVSETVPLTPELAEPLAARFRKDYDFGALVKTMLRSNLFFAPEVYRTRIKAPVDFALGIVRGLEGKIGTTALAATLDELGQNVFYPPSVKGWDGGQTWLNGQTLLFRQNLALALTSTSDVRFGRRVDPAAVSARYNKKSDAEAVDFFLQLFLQGDVPSESRTRLVSYLDKARSVSMPVYWTEDDVTSHRVRALCHLVLTLPEFQLD